MIIYRCDICQKDIKDFQEIGEFKIREKGFEFFKHKTEPVVKEKMFLLCVSCGKNIRDFIEGLQNSVRVAKMEIKESEKSEKNEPIGNREKSQT